MSFSHCCFSLMSSFFLFRRQSSYFYITQQLAMHACLIGWLMGTSHRESLLKDNTFTYTIKILDQWIHRKNTLIAFCEIFMLPKFEICIYSLKHLCLFSLEYILLKKNIPNKKLLKKTWIPVGIPNLECKQGFRVTRTQPV